MPQIAVVGNMEDVVQQLEASNKLLKAIAQAQSQFIVDANPRNLFDGLLETLLELTQSEYGFIGEINYTDKSEPQIEAHMKLRGNPDCKTHAITNIAWNDSPRNFSEEKASKVMEFYNLKTLFGAVIVTGEPVIANNPATDGRRGGLPDGHPPLNSFLGLPLFDRDKQLVGMVGIANSPGGYDELMITYLQPFLLSCSYVIAAHRNDKRRQEAEKKLRESEELFRATFEQAAVGIARVAADGTFLELNQKFCEIVGYTREEMLSLTFQDITHPEDLSADLDYLRQVLAGEIATYSMEKRYMGKDRSLQWVNLTVSLVREVSGEPKYFISVVEDINGRKQAEAAQKQSNNILRSVIESTTDVVFVKDIGGRYVIINSTGCRWLEKPIEEIIGKDDSELFPPEIALQLMEADQKMMLAGETLTYEEDVPENGVMRTLLTTKCPWRDAEGTVIGVVGISRDISDRKQAELALQEREQFLASIYDGVEHPIFVIDVLEDGDVRFAGMNPAGLSVSSTSIEQLCGKTPEQVYPEPIAASIRQHYTDCLKAGASISYEERMFFFGVETWWNTTLTPLRDLQGRIYRIIGMTLNVTPRKQAEEALRESQHFIQQIAEASPSFLYLYDMIDQRNVYANGELNGTLGYTSDELQKMGTQVLANLIHPDDFAQLGEYWKQFEKAKDGEIFEIEYRMKHKDGSWRWLVSRESVFSRTVDGKPKQRIGAATDITARKLAEEALQKSEAQFRQLAEREALLNRLANQIRNSLDINTILETTVQEIRSLLQLDSCLFIWYLPNGKDDRSKLPAWHVVHEAKNSDLPTLLGYYLTDATKRCFRAIANLEIIRIDDIEAVTNPVERQFFLTLGYKSLLNVPLQTKSGAIGMIACGSCIDWRGWKDDEVELLQAIAVQLLIAISQAELYAQTQNSARIAQEKAKQLEVTLQELQQTQAQLIQSEKMSSLGQMVAGIAHEINNPTSFIYSNIEPASQYIKDLFNLLELYQKNSPDPAVEIRVQIETIDLDFLVKDLPKLLNSMQVGAARIRDIVRSLRTFSRLDEADMKEIDIHEGIDSTLMILEHRLKKVGSFSGIQIIKEYGNLPLVECYAGQLNQVFMNILVNGIDALEEVIAFPGRSVVTTVNCKDEQNSNYQLPITNYQLPTIRIRTSVVEGNQVLIQIADNGPGMTEEVQRRLFEPFFTTKPVGSGTGLGMSISYQIIEKHGGQLKCISSPVQGAEFLIYLPIKSS
jgi:PAS domain S-box-containing protein